MNILIQPLIIRRFNGKTMISIHSSQQMLEKSSNAFFAFEYNLKRTYTHRRLAINPQ
jgi:hypothetical protein